MPEGPAYRCQNGIGYAVNLGERLRLYWGPKPDTGVSEIYRGERRFGVRGPIDPAKKLGRGKGLIAAGYTVGKRVISSDSSELILSPPDNSTDRPFLREIYIPHRNVDEAKARAFAERLEFVGAKDARCRR